MNLEDQNCIRLQADKDQIKNCKRKLAVRTDSFMELSQLLALAGNEVRLKILFLLEEEKELCPCDLADILEMSVPAISQHLRKMKDRNLINSRREGQTIFYSINTRHNPLFQTFFNRLTTLENIAL